MWQLRVDREFSPFWWLLTLVLSAAPSFTDDSLRILTYPTGLVTGELEVRVDLGSEEQPADLYLDGARVCSMRSESSKCRVNLGPDPRVHLLELVRQRGPGEEPERALRWVNRPGQEAELALVIVRSPGGEVCGARLGWAHPERQAPVELKVVLDGRELEILDGLSVRFPCPQPESSHVLVASAVFADGRRAEFVAVTGGFGDETSVELTAVPLVSEAGGASPCALDSSEWTAEAKPAAESGYEVVFVLDPEVRYRPLLTSGWDLSEELGGGFFERIASPSPTSGATETRGIQKPRPSWRKAKSTLFGAERIWYVAPDPGLHRVNGFAAGRSQWLELLFKFGTTEIPDRPRIADAVAASGLVAAAGPRRRAVVLLLGDRADEREGSVFTAKQARDYLAEIHVPLIVLRNGKVRDDGWPRGLKTNEMISMARNLDGVREVLDRQCVVWFPSHFLPDRLAELLPQGVHPAGHEGELSRALSVWMRADVEASPLGEDAVLAERLDVTAITVLLSAVGEGGRPVADLGVEEIEVLENGEPVEILDLVPLATVSAEEESTAIEGVAPTPSVSAEETVLPITVYVDRILGGGSDLKRALRALVGEADRLVALGPVEIVVAAVGGVEVLLGSTRDAAAVGSALELAASQTAAIHAIERIRSSFVRGLRKRAVGNQSKSAAVATAATAAAGEESVFLSRSLERLRLWALGGAGHRVGLLLVVGGGFDEDPASFYLPFIENMEPHNIYWARENLGRRRLSEAVTALGRELAGVGWRMQALAGNATASPTYSAELRRTDKVQSFTGPDFNLAPGAEESPWLMVDPIGTLRHLASASGGDATVGSAGLRAVLDESAGWYLLTYQVQRPPDGTVHDLEIRPVRTGVELTTNRVVTAATSEGQSEARLRRLLRESTSRGELPVELAIGLPSPTGKENLTADVETTVRFSSLAPLLFRTEGGPTLRISVAVEIGGRTGSVEHRLGRPGSEAAEWVYEFPLAWPAEERALLAVTVEDLASGIWGGAVLELPGGS
jgi:hypothetical protein